MSNSTPARVSFPELAVRLSMSKGPSIDTMSFHTFNVDADDEGKAHDYGEEILEEASIVGDGTRTGYDEQKIKQFASLWEHSPELFELVEAIAFPERLTGRHPLKLSRNIIDRAQRIIREIESGELKYEGR